MKKEEIIKILEIFKNQIRENKFDLDYDELNKYFFIQNYFIARESPYFEEQFFETFLQIVGNSLKSIIQNLEYYVSIKPQNPAMSSDFEVLKENKEILKLYLKFHKYFKKFNLLFISHKQNSIEVINYILELFEMVKDYYRLAEKTELKLLENLDKKIIEFDVKKDKFESSVFN